MKPAHLSCLTLLPLALLTFGCDGAPGEDDTGLDPFPQRPSLSPFQPQQIDAGATATYTITNLDDAQAYRVTLVVDANISPVGNGTARFVDGDGDGAADAGLSEEIALITSVNGGDVPGAKTVPGGDDNPAAPTGVFPVNGQITVTITGVAEGTVHPVAYTNAGASTFLEIDAATLSPSEPHGVGGALTVVGEAPTTTDPGGIAVAPADEQTVAVDGVTTYTVSGLNDTYAYRITLVLDEYITLTGGGMATFLDGDANGAADPGASELVANIVYVNGEAVAGTKTVPGGEDDPAAPTGVFPVGGQITLDVMGLAPGKVHPVAYRNGGLSTFLEIDAVTGSPVEEYYVGGAFYVQ
jgi:hypothetical protein